VSRRFVRLCLAVVASAAWLAMAPPVATADEQPALQADKAALAPLQPYVGQWRGVGLPKRGSNQGAWTEQADWQWHFAEGHAELVGGLAGGKYFDRLEVRPGKQPGEFVVLASAAQVSEEGQGSGPARYTGKLTDGVLRV